MSSSFEIDELSAWMSVLRQKYKKDHALVVKSIYKTRIDDGVLSNVSLVQLEYEQEPKEAPKAFIVKSLRSDLPMTEMLLVETTFYTRIAPQFNLPFRIPAFIHSSDSCLIIERIECDKNFKVTESCPKDFLQRILIQLAKMHALFWKHPECKELATVAGIGSALDGPTKEKKFPTAFETFVERLEHQKQEIKTICQDRLCRMSLAELHDQLHDKAQAWTMIHGDFHMGNLLFRAQEVFLIDWATCGKGNPLRDVVFFFIVSCDFWTQSVTENRQQVLYYLKLYHNALNLASFSWIECQEAYELCVLNQFAILVCYDDFCTQLASTSPKLYDHFQRVNTRASRALLALSNHS